MGCMQALQVAAPARVQSVRGDPKDPTVTCTTHLLQDTERVPEVVTDLQPASERARGKALVPYLLADLRLSPLTARWCWTKVE